MLGRTESAYRWFTRSSGVDLYAKEFRTSGGTFIGEIRTAASAATWLIITGGFAKMRTNGPQLTLSPDIPAHWNRVSFRLEHRGTRLDIAITAGEVTVTAAEDGAATVPITVWNEFTRLEPGVEHTFTRP